ncbi:hypothetical protein [Clostridium sp. DJ247]|uniref:hypothetical protein n=1 Tax=Clostridium sp. DJ247 TaxID=2726188 RepID=UPI001624F489|nr:hypothetical protein [Clostridium sp. DJ247]MBC2582118.1 hypothetical protein [Clostridium sp. DJ247]
MDNNEKVLIGKELIVKIQSGLHTIRLTTKDKNIKKEAETLLKLLETETTFNSLSLEEKILQKMKETKGTDPDLNANLYILHRKLVNKQISEQQALQLLEMYIKTEVNEGGFF